MLDLFNRIFFPEKWLSRHAIQPVHIVSRQIVKRPVETKIINDWFFNHGGLNIVLKEDGYLHMASLSWSQILGYTMEEFMSKDYLHYVHPEDIQKTKAEFDRQRKERRTSAFTNRYLAKDGSYVTLTWNTDTYVVGEFIMATANPHPPL